MALNRIQKQMLDNGVQEELNKIPILNEQLEEIKIEAQDKFQVIEGQIAQESEQKEYGSIVQPEDKSKLFALIERNKPLKIAILGDSTQSGIGWRGSAYGECGDILKPVIQERFSLNLIFSNPYFIKPSKSYGGRQYQFNRGVNNPNSSMPTEFDRWELISSQNPNFSIKIKHLPEKRNKITMYYLQRTANAAAIFDCVVGDTTTSIDTYKPVQSFGTVVDIPQDGWSIGIKEIEVPTSGDFFELNINNVRVTTRPEGSAGVGTAVIIGLQYGEPIYFRNFAVRTTTLLNNSTQNQMRGVTTEERLQKSYDFGANVFMIGWGTNDQNLAGVTAEQYEQMLSQRIDEIRSQDEGAIIVLNSAKESSANDHVFRKMKQVALNKRCSFFDIGELFKKFPDSDVVGDYVHPNESGYRIGGEALCALLGVPSTKETYDLNNVRVFNVVDNDFVVESGTFVPILMGGTTTSAQTYEYCSGMYHRMGKLVTVNVAMRITAKGALSGALSVGGLPYPSKSTEYYNATGVLEFSGFNKPEKTDFHLRIRSGEDKVSVRKTKDLLIANDATAEDINVPSIMIFSIQYEID